MNVFDTSPKKLVLRCYQSYVHQLRYHTSALHSMKSLWFLVQSPFSDDFPMAHRGCPQGAFLGRRAPGCSTAHRATGTARRTLGCLTWEGACISPRCSMCGRFTLEAGWWFGTFFIFPYIGNNHPNWLIFFRGVAQPPTRKVGIEVAKIGIEPPQKAGSWGSGWVRSDSRWAGGFARTTVVLRIGIAGLHSNWSLFLDILV